MSRRKGTRPEQYAGPFQEYSDIPPRYRLEMYASHYRGRETWQRYCTEVLFEEYSSDYMEKSARIASESWKEYMHEQNRHHALATPKHVDEWCQEIREGRTRQTSYEHYYLRIYHFYDYLKMNRQHPHLYNPLLIAAIEYEVPREIWMHRVDSRPEVVGRE